MTSPDFAPPAQPRSFPRWLGADARLAGPLGLLLAIALCVIARPYTGVRHDAVLYLGQALDHVWPQVLNQDLFFLYGSQDKFSFFSSLLAPLITRFGVGPSEIGLLLACQLAFIVATWMLTKHLSAQTRWIAVLCAAAFPHKYASLNIFGFAENFLTARSIAEPLAIFGLAAWMAHRRLLSLALFAAGALMHPLIVIPMLVIVWVMQIRVDRRWLFLLLLALPILGLAFARVAPFGGLLDRYDNAWWAMVKEFDRHVLVTRWEYLDWQSAAVDVVILWLALRHAGERLRDLIIGTLWATGGLLVVAIVGVDLMHDVLLTGLQLWRVLWITHLFTLLCLPTVALGYWREGPRGRLIASAACAALIAVGASFAMGWILVLWLIATAFLQRHATPISSLIYRMALGAAIAAIAVVTLVESVMTLRRIAANPELEAITHPALVLLTLPALALAFAAIIMVVMRRLPTPACVALVLGTLAVGLFNWDQRGAWSVEIESAMFKTHPFDRDMSPTAQVYWSGEQMFTNWMLLKRPTYMSPDQGAALLFNRATAMEFQRRHNAFVGLELQAHLCSVVNEIIGASPEDTASCSPTQPVVDEICQSATPPDFMVFPLKLPRGVVDSWTFAPGAPVSPRTFYLYDCSHLR